MRFTLGMTLAALAALAGCQSTSMEGGDREQTMSFSLVPGTDGMLQVVGDDQQLLGRGFCLGQECSYRAEIDGITVEENVRFTHGELVKFGVKSGPGFSVVWREVLTELYARSGTFDDPRALETIYTCAHDITGEVEICVDTVYGPPIGPGPGSELVAVHKFVEIGIRHAWITKCAVGILADDADDPTFRFNVNERGLAVDDCSPNFGSV